MAKTKNQTRAERLPGESLAVAAAQCDEVRERILHVRKYCDLTCREVAMEMGISRGFYTQLENGTRRMDIVYFLAICRALRVEPGELLK